MRFRFPVIGAGRNQRAMAEDLGREETPEEIAAAQQGIDDYWAEVEPLGDVALYLQPDQMSRDEDEAYARNFAMDRQAEHINSRVCGLGPGYEEVPGWIRIGPERTDPQEAKSLEARAAADRDYLDWLDAEWVGQERGNPPKSRELDDLVDGASSYYPETKEQATDMQRGPAGQWTFEDWAEARGYTEDDIDIAIGVESHRERRLAQREGEEIVSELDRMIDDPQYADVRDQIVDMTGYVSKVMELGDKEPGELWASGEV